MLDKDMASDRPTLALYVNSDNVIDLLVVLNGDTSGHDNFVL